VLGRAHAACGAVDDDADPTLAHVSPLQARVVLLRRNFLEAPQGPDLAIELRHTIHWIDRPSLTLPIEPPDQVTVVFRSKPDGATVLVNRAAVGRTPHKAQFPRSEESIAYELRLDGYTSLADVVRPTDDSTVSAVLAKIPAQPKRKPVKKKKKRGKPTAPRVKTEIGLGDMK
jgi:hypothetical protein